MERTDPAGLFEATLAEPGEGTPAYRLEAEYEDGTTYSYQDPPVLARPGRQGPSHRA